MRNALSYFIFTSLFIILSVSFFDNSSARAAELEEWDASADVPINKEWTVTLSSYIDSTTLNDESVYVLDSENNKVATSLTIGKADNEILIKPPKEGYSPGRVYTIHITNKLKDYQSHPLKKTIRKSFQIEQEETASASLKNNVIKIPSEEILNSDSNHTNTINTSGEKAEDIVLSSTNQRDLKVGDVLLLNEDDNNGDQQARKIEKIIEIDGMLTAETSIPYLEEVASSLNVNQSIPITSENIDRKSLKKNITIKDYREYDRKSAKFFEGLEYEFNKFPIEMEQQVLFVTGKLRLQNPILEPYFEWKGIRPDLDSMKFVLKTDIITQLSFDFGSSIPLKKFNFDEIPLDLGKFRAPVPQLPGLTLDGKIGSVVKVSAIGGFQTTISNSTYAEVGIIKDRSKIQPVHIFKNQTDVFMSGYGGIEVKVGFGPTLSASYLGIELVSISNDLGPYGNVKLIKGSLQSDKNETLTCTAGEIGLYHDIGGSLPVLKKLSPIYKFKFYGKKIPGLYVINDCKSTKEITFSVDKIDIKSGETKIIEVLGKEFDLSTGFSQVKNLTKDVKFSSNDPSVTITPSGRVRVKEYQTDKNAVITATYEENGKEFSAKLIVSVKADPDIPPFNQNELTRKHEYKESYEIKNSTDMNKFVNLPQTGDYATYSTEGSVHNFSIKSNYLTIPANGTAIVSFDESLKSKFNLDSDLILVSTEEAALKSVFHLKNGSTKWTNTGGATEIKVSSGKYGFVSSSQSRKIVNFDLVNDQSQFISIPEKGTLHINSMGDSVINVYAPNRSFKYVNASEPALDVQKLDRGQSMEAINQGDNEDLRISGKGKYDYAIYFGDTPAKVKSFERNKSIHSWHNSHYLAGRERMNLYNPDSEQLTVYAPKSTFSMKRSNEPALDTFILSAKETVEAANKTAYSQSIKIFGDGRYDYANYFDKLATDVRSFENAQPIYSWDSSESVKDKGTIVLTNPEMNEIIVYAPRSLFDFSKSSEPALKEYTLPGDGSMQALNDSGQRQSIKIKGDNDYDYTNYDDMNRTMPRDFNRRTPIYSWDSSEYIQDKGTIVVTNPGSDDITVYTAYPALNFSESKKPALDFLEIPGGEIGLIENSTNLAQKIKVIKDSNIDQVTYNDASKRNINSFAKNETIYSWDTSFRVPETGQMAIRNNDLNKSTLVYVPKDLFKLRLSDQPILKTIELQPGQSTLLKNITATTQPFKIRGKGTYDYKVYTETNGQITEHEKKDVPIYTWDNNMTMRSNQKFKVTNSSVSTLIIYMPVGIFD